MSNTSEVNMAKSCLQDTNGNSTGQSAEQSTEEAERLSSDNQRGETMEVDNAPDQSAEAANNVEPPMSKNQLKKLKRKQQWEEQKAQRKQKKKEHRNLAKERRKAQRQEKIAEAEAAGIDRRTAIESLKPIKRKRRMVPLSLIIDCDFEKYMTPAELISMSSQITRSYSDNRNAEYRTHLFVSSWGGQLQQRSVEVLDSAHERYEDFHVVEQDFVQAAKQAQALMEGSEGGETIELLRATDESAEPEAQGSTDTTALPKHDPATGEPSVVYLTSDSPYTLKRLEANTSYIIGGIVDRNREKGLCYKKAMEYGVRTAKLPIGDYMMMASRQVLTTNQVVEIMLRWLECGDWGFAFDKVIPKRKGGRLKSELQAEQVAGQDEDEVKDEEGDEEAEGGAPLKEQDDATQPQVSAAEAT